MCRPRARAGNVAGGGLLRTAGQVRPGFNIGSERGTSFGQQARATNSWTLLSCTRSLRFGSSAVSPCKPQSVSCATGTGLQGTRDHEGECRDVDIGDKSRIESRRRQQPGHARERSAAETAGWAACLTCGRKPFPSLFRRCALQNVEHQAAGDRSSPPQAARPPPARGEIPGASAGRSASAPFHRAASNHLASERTGTSPLAPLSATVTKSPNRVTPEIRAAKFAPTLSAMYAAR